MTVKKPAHSEMRTELGLVQLSVHYFVNLSSGRKFNLVGFAKYLFIRHACCPGSIHGAILFLFCEMLKQLIAKRNFRGSKCKSFQIK